MEGDRTYYPASANQKRMYILNQLSPGGTEYNVPVAIRLEGELDVRRLRSALSVLVARHASLRTSFDLVDAEVVQTIERRPRIRLPRRRAKTRADIEAIKQSFVQPFDLRRAPLFRACLIRMGPAEHILLLDLHHIICDGVSVSILIDELGRLYDGQMLKNLPAEYRDFALWQRSFARTAEARQQEAYWLGLLGGERPALNLPADYPRKQTQSFAGDRVFVPIGQSLSAGLQALIAKQRVSMYMVLLAAYYVLLSKYTGQADFVVGTLVAGREAEQFRGTVGLFVNTLLLRSRPTGDLEFVQYLKQVRGECLNAFENQDYQFEDLVDRISPPRDLGRNPLFDTMFGALAYDERIASYRGVRFSRYELDYAISKFDLSLTVIEQQDHELVLEFEYCTDLFRKATIERLSEHYLNLLAEIVANPRARLSELNILTAAEQRELLAQPVGHAGKAESVVELFQAQARSDPAAPAVAFGTQSLSYGELDRRANALAAGLRARGVVQGDLVGVVAAPSIEGVIAVLGVLKLGAAYLPIDPKTPAERFRTIVADSGIATLLLQRAAPHFACPGLTSLLIDHESRDRGADALPPATIAPDDLAYVIYTSGSTGTPKGVMVSHAALTNYITWATRTYVGEERIAFALHSPLSVDLTVTSVFVPLVSGNRIVIYQHDDALSLIEEIVRDNQVEALKLTPAHLSLLAEVIRDSDRDACKLRKLIVGGEDLKTSLAANIHAGFGGRVELFNEYGPTEATVGCMIYTYNPATDTALSVPIGAAINNAWIGLLDQYGNPVPAGALGEICIGGVCLAQGYLNRPDLTAERFVPNPFSENKEQRTKNKYPRTENQEPRTKNQESTSPVHPFTRSPAQGGRLYRTGDLARMLPDGTIEYLGRNDDQVKVRGFRIELGEIEAQLRRLPRVRDAVVTRRTDAAGDSYLCAYLVADGAVSTADVRNRLAEQLPQYMVPAWFVPLERFPIGPGGKLDKQALPDPREFMLSARPYAAPRSKAEAALARIWEQVLGLPRAGIDDNFFELGGQSLKATLMIARANRELRASISLRDVFAHPSIRALAALVEQTGEDTSTLIEPAGAQAYYPASSAQKRLYILNQLAPTDVQYNVPWALKITGPFDAGRWERAFRALIARHESLRTSFALIDDEIVQTVHPETGFAFERLSSNEAGNLQPAIERFVRPFDLSKARLIRAAVVETGALVHTLIVDMHHIVTDGLSVEIILDELRLLYQGQTLEAPALQYKDYAVWQRAYARSAAVQAQGAYWTSLFEGEVPVLNLPTDFPRRAVQSFEGDLVAFKVGAETVEALRAVNRACGTTMHMTLLAAYTILLAKYSGQEDIIVGTPVAGRNHALLQQVVGMFVNTLAMRNQPRGDLTFAEFLGMVKRNALDAYSNQEYQFEELVDKLAIERNLSRNPLFDTVFASAGGQSKTLDIDGLNVELLDFDWKISKFDLTLLAAEREQVIDFELEYCTRLFRRSTIERLSVHFRHILEQIAHDPDRKIVDIDPLTAADRHQILVEFNRTEQCYPADRSIHAIFEEQAARHPGNTGVVFGAVSLSYDELNRRANQIAHLLVHVGVAREEIVAIMAGPSVEMIVGILGILKAGCAYLPIDRDCPEQRAQAILHDSGARIVLVAGGAEWHDQARLVLDLSDSSLYQGDDSNLGQGVTGRDLAYVIYTSGTTGVPKGVLVEHHSVNNLCAWHNAAFKVTAADRATKYARFGFDASVWEIFPYLQAGAALHMIDEPIRLDLPRLNRYFEEHGITISFLPTQVCELFMELDNTSLRVLLTGGDRLRRYRPKNYTVVNNYGPTEYTVVTTSGEMGSEVDRIPIGKPVFNTRVYLLGKGDKLVPIGVPGELCIAGAGLARAYLNQPDLTAERFATDPFAENKEQRTKNKEPRTTQRVPDREPRTDIDSPVHPLTRSPAQGGGRGTIYCARTVVGGRMYRTGDLARWLPDGSIEFIGRTDKQVKIRGCRTEPREIEATILAHEAVKDAVVLARQDSQNTTFLCAYIVWHAAEAWAELRAYLARQLPDYMVPAFLLTVERIPMNATGKIDADKLPNPDAGPADGQGYVAARTETERRLADIWCQVLDRQQIGVYDNFFEAGGDSLRATILLAKANKAFATDVPLGAVFDNPSIAALARCFEDGTQPELVVPKVAENRRYYPTTPTQALLYAVCTARKGIEYNLPIAFELRGELNIARLERVFQQLIRRHEALRTSFRIVGKQVMQSVSRTVDFAIDMLPECGEDEITEVARDFIQPFDLAAAPLLRVGLVPMGSDRHVLLMDMHHLVSDGTSMGILYQEMAALYAGEEPPLPAVTAKDFAEWLGGHLHTEKVRRQEQYWLSVLRDPPPIPQLDTDHPRPESFSFAGRRLSFKAAPDVYSRLKALCTQHGATLYMVLLAAYNVLLSKYSGREDIIVGVPTAGRYIADVQNVVGMFVSTHAIRSQPQADLRFNDFLQQVKTGVRGALEHQEYQLWDMMLTHTIATGGSALFSTVFVVQDQAFTAMEMPGLNVEEIDAGYHVSKFDMTLGAVERATGLEFELEYSTDVFRRSTAKRFAGHYLHILEQIAAEPGRELRRIELITGAEKAQILHTFNGNRAEYTFEETVAQVFERQARETPDRVAVVHDGESMTYRELNKRANQLARHLRKQGLETGDIVGIMARSSFEMIIAILAAWKAGAAYIPVGTHFPRNRVIHLLAETGAKMLLCDEAGGSHFKAALVNLRDAQNYDPDGSNLDMQADAGALAYVSYSADPAGVLRGVMIEHQSLLDRCRWYAGHFALTPGDRSAKYGDLAAGATVFELFPFLCAGASIAILPEQIEWNADLLNAYFEAHAVTISWLPAPLCAGLALAEHTPLRLLITSGRNVNAARAGSYEFVRCSGPAENTEITTACAVRGDGGGTIIGKPITNAEIYIIGHDGGLLPAGITGELCVGGPGLTRGYWGDHKATASRFTANPEIAGARMYRTGQPARWLPDGRVELTGRVEEVSIAGQRVGLAEIKRHLEAHPSIAEAAIVFDDADPLRQRLVAFIVVRGGLQAPPYAFVQGLRAHLEEWLPGSMIPDTYIKVAMIPRGTDGQVQFERLTLPEEPADTKESTAPQPPAAGTVTSIVEDLLHTQQVGADANLFDLGMNSLMISTLLTRIDGAFGVAPDICQVLAAPTITGISHYLAALCGNNRSFAPV